MHGYNVWQKWYFWWWSYGIEPNRLMNKMKDIGVTDSNKADLEAPDNAIQQIKRIFRFGNIKHYTIQ